METNEELKVRVEQNNKTIAVLEETIERLREQVDVLKTPPGEKDYHVVFTVTDNPVIEVTINYYCVANSPLEAVVKGEHDLSKSSKTWGAHPEDISFGDYDATIRYKALDIAAVWKAVVYVDGYEEATYVRYELGDWQED